MSTQMSGNESTTTTVHPIAAFLAEDMRGLLARARFVDKALWSHNYAAPGWYTALLALLDREDWQEWHDVHRYQTESELDMTAVVLIGRRAVDGTPDEVAAGADWDRSVAEGVINEHTVRALLGLDEACEI